MALTPIYTTPVSTTLHAYITLNHAGDSIARLQAQVRGRYQRRLLAKAKREAKELERREALGQVNPQSDAHLYDEFGNKRVRLHP